MRKQENTNIMSSLLISSLTFFLGLAVGLATLWSTSTKWDARTTELLFEIKELRKEHIHMSKELHKLSELVIEHEKIIYNIKKK